MSDKEITNMDSIEQAFYNIHFQPLVDKLQVEIDRTIKRMRNSNINSLSVLTIVEERNRFKALSDALETALQDVTIEDDPIELLKQKYNNELGRMFTEIQTAYTEWDSKRISLD